MEEKKIINLNDLYHENKKILTTEVLCTKAELDKFTEKLTVVANKLVDITKRLRDVETAYLMCDEDIEDEYDSIEYYPKIKKKIK